MRTELINLRRDWEKAGANGPDPVWIRLENMSDRDKNRLNKEEKKAARWSRRDLARMTAEQLAKLSRRAARNDCPELVSNIAVVLAQRATRAARLRKLLAERKAKRKAEQEAKRLQAHANTAR